VGWARQKRSLTNNSPGKKVDVGGRLAELGPIGRGEKSYLLIGASEKGAWAGFSERGYPPYDWGQRNP